MREARVFSEMVGKFFCLNPEESGSILVTRAWEVNDFCSRSFVFREDLAIIEFGKSPNGDDVVHFKTLFKGCGINAYLVSPPCAYTRIGKDGLRKFILSSSQPIIEDWGINLLELIDLVFRTPPVLTVATAQTV